MLSQIAGGKCSIVQNRSLVPAPGCSMEKEGFTTPGEGRMTPPVCWKHSGAHSWKLWAVPPAQEKEKEAPEPELRVHSSLLGGNGTCVSSHGPATQCGNHVKTNV